MKSGIITDYINSSQCVCDFNPTDYTLSNTLTAGNASPHIAI